MHVQQQAQEMARYAILMLHFDIVGCHFVSARAMDETDRRLLALLRRNARTPVAALASQLGVSRGTVQNRIDRLLARGVLLGFTVRTASDADAPTVRALMMLAVEGDRGEAVLEALRGFPEVRAVHTTNGRWDIIAELGTESLEAFDDALRRIRTIRGVASSETSLLLRSRRAG
jgi:DNA-binding Lrp family transcriptional regulator